tara:strand:+ start:38 stop:739 length:702 start_codon:yes stop_codon:yes gene_type:complete
MADINKILDNIADEFADKVDLAKKEVVESLMEFIKGKNAEEALEILSGFNMESAMDLKLSNAFIAYESGIVSMLESTFTTTTLSEATLTRLLNNTKGMVSDEVTKHLSKVSIQSIIDGIASGKSPAEVIAVIDEVMPRIDTLINTAYSQFSNSVTNMMAEKLPKDTKFVYIGAYDDKTRDECIEKIEFGSGTREQIVAQFGDMNNEIFNCRHKWEEMSSNPADQGYNPEKFNA